MDFDASISATPLYITCMCGESLIWWRDDLRRQTIYSHPNEVNASFTLTDRAREQNELEKVGDWLMALHEDDNDDNQLIDTAAKVEALAERMARHGR